MRFPNRNHPLFRFARMLETPVLGLLPDTALVNTALSQLTHFIELKSWANLSRPRYFSEWLMREKLSGFARRPLVAATTDKLLAKDYVAQRVGAGVPVPTLAVLDSDAGVAAYDFPAPCVIKPTHLVGEVIFLRSERPSHRDYRRMRRWLRSNYFHFSREPNYKPLRPRIVVEPFLTPDGRQAPDDVKVLCFAGAPRLIQLDVGRASNHRRALYDMEGNLLPLAFGYPPYAAPFPYPDRLAEVARIARALSADFRFVRVDLYVLPGQIHFGELTHFPRNCAGRFAPESADLEIARMLRAALAGPEEAAPAPGAWDAAAAAPEGARAA